MTGKADPKALASLHWQETYKSAHGRAVLRGIMLYHCAMEMGAYTQGDAYHTAWLEGRRSIGRDIRKSLEEAVGPRAFADLLAEDIDEATLEAQGLAHALERSQAQEPDAT